jgi:protoheme IX farnesyltransferase
VVAGDETATGRVALLFALALLPVSLLPALSGQVGLLYLVGAVVLGVLQAAAAWPLASRGGPAAARRLLLASVAYLPALLLLMALDRQV